jgi:hypothetical protein
VDGTKQRPGRPPRGDEPRAWGSIALAVGIAALGVQVGRLTWQTPVDPPRVAALRWEPAPDLPLEPALGHRFGLVPPGMGLLARATPGFPSDSPAPSESATPAGPPIPPELRPPGPIIGPIAPPSPGYVGKPLPLPNPDQVRFLLRHDPLVRVRPADPLRIAPDAMTPLPASPGSLLARSDPATMAVLAHRQETGRAPQGRSVPPRRAPLSAHGPAGPPLGLDVRDVPEPGPDVPPLSVAANASQPATAPPSAPAAGSAPGGAEAPKPAPGGGTPSGAALAASETNGTASTPAPGSGNPPAASSTHASPPATGSSSPGTTSATGASPPPQAGEAKAGEAEQPHASAEAPLRLRLTIDGGSGQRVAPGQLALVRVAASAPCHVAVYRIDAHGRITPLLSLSGAARMKPASAFSLAVKVSPVAGATGQVVRERVVAIGSRRPLTSQEAQICVQGFAPASDDSSDPAQPVQEMPLAAALRALADYAGRQPAGLIAAHDGGAPASATCAVASFLVEAR